MRDVMHGRQKKVAPAECRAAKRHFDAEQIAIFGLGTPFERLRDARAGFLDSQQRTIELISRLMFREVRDA
jgi:hypothetical protein